mgnify:CR=1 FL=1
MKFSNTYDVFEHYAINKSDLPALTEIKDLDDVSQSETWSYAEFYRLINRTARLIQHYSETERPHCAFLLPQIPQAQFIMWGASAVGAVAPLNPLLHSDAIASLLERSETEVLFVPGPESDPELWQKVQSAIRQLPKLKAVITVGTPAEQGASCHYDDVVSDFSDEALPQSVRAKPDDVCAFFHTGGTTGLPKLAIHTHAAQLAAVEMWNQSIKDLPEAVTINGLPTFHVAGSLLNGICNFGVGGHVVLPHPAGYRDAATVQSFWRLIEDYQVNVAFAIPTTLGTLAQLPVNGAKLDSFKCFVTGGAIVSESVSRALMENCGRPVFEMYGMTEGCGVLSLPDTHGEPVLRSSGKPASGSEIRIGDQGAAVGVSGEVQFRGANLFSGYIGHQEDPFTADGWLKTGDLGYLDEEGYLFLTGRAKDLIIRSGHNIDPIVIESCLEKHPAVSMAAAVGKPDRYAGELPIVYVELIQGTSVTEAELIEFAQANIDERPACPKAVHIIPELPKTAVGKIFKPDLRTRAIANVLTDELVAQGIEDSLNVEVSLTKKGVVNAQVKVEASLLDQVKSITDELAQSYKLDVSVSA